MPSPIQANFESYQNKFPLYSRDAIVDMMLKDGAITPDAAKKIKSGTSLFMIDNSFEAAKTEWGDFDSTEVFGGEFSCKPAVKQHDFTTLVEVGGDGKIFNSQFTVEGIRKKYSEKDYEIKVEKDNHNVTYVTIYDKKTGKKAVTYDIEPPARLSGYVSISTFDSDGNLKEYAMVKHGMENDCSVIRVDKYEGKTRLSTFYDGDNIKKTRIWEEIKKDTWDITQETFYSDNKPYKVIEGDKTIANYMVDELAKYFDGKDGLGIVDLINLQNLVDGITPRNVWEVLYDYQNQTGRDLMDDIESVGAAENVFYKQKPVFRMLKHIEEASQYEGSAVNDNWLNDHAERYITDKLVRDLSDGKLDKFKEHLKFAGINLNQDEKEDAFELFGNTMIKKVLLNFQKKAGALHEDDTSNTTKGILYTLARCDKIPEKERANILLDIISQIRTLAYEPELTKEVYDFTQNEQFIDLIINNCTDGNYCEDIKADMVLNKKNPEKLLIDFKRLEARNEVRQERSFVSSPNGKIDIDFKQGNTGDCWLLAGVISLVSKEAGKKSLESLLKVDPKTGDVMVTLKGAKKTYKITAEEIKNANHLSGGDGDMRALELAFDKFIRELAYEKQEVFQSFDINGNTTHYLYEILFGNGHDMGKYKRSMNDDLNNPNKAFCLGANQFETDYSDTVGAVLNFKGEEVDFVLGHAYAVVKADDKYVYLVNPWDSKETLRITHENLEKLKANIGACSY